MGYDTVERNKVRRQGPQGGAIVLENRKLRHWGVRAAKTRGFLKKVRRSQGKYLQKKIACSSSCVLY
jgi:hypothetical protein